MSEVQKVEGLLGGDVGLYAPARVAELKRDNARLRDLVAKFQRGEPSDKFQEHGA